MLLLLSACAPKIVPPPVVSSPKFPEFVVPALPAAFANTAAASAHDRGWRFLQAGDLKNAEREFSVALKTAAAFYPAEASLGYVELARKDPRAALPHFDRALDRYGSDAGTLVGRGQTLLALNRNSEALAAFSAALAADPSLVDIARRVDVLKFRTQQDDLVRARDAARAGRADEAIREYTAAIAGSPDSPFLYRELADVERQKGDVDAALDHFRKTVSLDPTDARSLTEIGEILESRADFEGATTAYSEALAIEPNAAVETRLELVRARAALARLPDDYRAIETLPQITRGDLAALVGVRLAPLIVAARRRDAVLVTDVRSHWAATWILAVARAGVMDPFANHAFQPRTLVRRVDLAQVVSRLLSRVAPRAQAQAKSWESARLKFSDLSAGHLAYVAASQAVASGVMRTAAGTSFQPSRPVGGAEAVETIGRIEALAGMKAPR